MYVRYSTVAVLRKLFRSLSEEEEEEKEIEGGVCLQGQNCSSSSEVQEEQLCFLLEVVIDVPRIYSRTTSNKKQFLLYMRFIAS